MARWIPGAITLLLLIQLLPSAATEDLPRKVPMNRYAPLWSNSPFTSRPPVLSEEPTPEVDPFETYALLGVSPSADGFRVTLINRNDPAERIVIDSGRSSVRHDFKILDIDRKPGLPLATTVRLSRGATVGTVAFESSLLTLSTPPAASPQPQPNAAPGANPAQPQPDKPQIARRPPRPRVVPPPAGAQQPANAPAANPTPRGAPNAPLGGRDRSERRLRR